MIRYTQQTGKLALFTRDASGSHWEDLGTGYSGNTTGLNNPAAENEAGVGPIPSGLWSISRPYTDDHLGVLCFRLVPMNYFGPRNSFRIHGDNAKLDHSASDGCIVLAHEIRQKLADTKQDYLLVEST